MKKEHDKQAIEYACGFKKYYNLAKRWNSIIIIISFILAIICTISKDYSGDKVFIFLNLIWMLVSFRLAQYIGKNRKKAADLQEYYDNYVLGIDRNELIIYPKEDEYKIKNNRKFNEEAYYNIQKENLKSIDIYNIQKDNIIHDKEIRKIYRVINYIYAGIYMIIIFFVSFIKNLNTYQLAIVIIVPSVYIINYIVSNICNLNKEIEIIGQNECSINEAINWSNKISESENFIIIRRFQDFIYLKRKNWIMIPNLIYKIYIYRKNKYYIINIDSNEKVNFIENKDLQNEAMNIVKRLAIVEFLKEYGQVEIVGSVANNLIIEKDIDIHLLTLKNIDKIKRKMEKYLKNVQNIKDITSEKHLSKKAICLIIKDYQKWKIEIWISNDKKYVGFELKDELGKLLDIEKRKTIMELKEYYYNKGLLKGKMSTSIYLAVIYGKVKSIKEFEKLKKIWEND